MLNTQNILERLAAADRAHQKEAGGLFLLGKVKYAGAVVLPAFILDVIFHLAAGWRLGILLAMIAGVLALAGSAWYLAFVRRNRLEHIARFLETRDPALGSRLINFLQLGRQTQDPSLAPATRELARQAVDDYAGGLREVPMERLARTEALGRQLRRAAWALLGLAAVLALVFRVSAVEIARFADPFGDHPPYSFTHLQILQPGPAGTNVLYDKGLVVKVKATGHQPKEVLLTAFPPGRRDQAFTLPMFDKTGAGYDQLLDNIHSELVVFAHTKDNVTESKQARIGVTLTPQLEKMFVRVAPPEYTGIKPEESPYSFKSVQALEGGELRFRIASNRPLREGSLDLTSGDAPPQHVALVKSADKEVSGSFIAAESGRMRFSITDTDGLASQGDCEGALTVTRDLPPEVRLANPDKDAFVAMDFKLQAVVEAGDDYGLRQVRLHRGLNGVFSAPKTFSYTNIVRDTRETFDFQFADLGVQPGDVVSLFAEALDTAPQPHLSRSQTVRLQVISVEDYNNFLREQSDIADAEAKYAALNDELQALIDQQKQLGGEIQKLGDQLAKTDASQSAALAQQLDSLIAKQNELNQKLNQEASRMDNFVRDIPLYDVEKDLQEALRQQAEAIRQSASANDAAARQIAQRSSPPSGGRTLSPDMLNDLKKASDEQVARLGGAQEANDKQVVQKLDDMAQMQALINDFNSFESLYRAQQDLAAQAAAYNRPGQLSREDQLALKELAATEKQVSDSLGRLAGNLRQDAAAAQKLFPKAAQSGRDLADQMASARLEPLAEQATSQMLAGRGDQASELADRLRGEMEKMVGQSSGGDRPSSGELDAYLKLQGMRPGDNFAQMSRSRKFGSTSQPGHPGGRGQGESGDSGYAMTDGSALNVMGNESRPVTGKNSRQSARLGSGAGALPGAGSGETDKSDATKGLKPVNLRSAAVSSEAVIAEYNDVVENYFKAITSRKDKPANEKQN
ncbi:MAG: hypothetical protein ABSA47_00100 [Verrucomicrobiota bacterium]|jgi:hypothetical protein